MIGTRCSTAFPRFESYRHINQPRPEEHTRRQVYAVCASLTAVRASRRTATSETEPAAILRDGAPQVGCARLYNVAKYPGEGVPAHLAAQTL